MSVTVGIVAQRSNDDAAALVETLYEELDAELLLDTSVAAGVAGSGAEGVPLNEMADADFVVSIGGDGTLLAVARGTSPAPIVGVNLGEVGFLNAVPPESAVATVGKMADRVRDRGRPRWTELPMVTAQGQDWELPPALNEVAVVGGQRGRGGGLDMEVIVDGAVYSETHADGLLVCTPTGSSAYNLSEGGPLVYPAVDALTLTEMAATDPMPSLVVNLDMEIAVRVTSAERMGVVADGRTTEWLEPPVTVDIHRAGRTARIAGPPPDFFSALKKLR
jgi:NAD+ kinase